MLGFLAFFFCRSYIKLKFRWVFFRLFTLARRRSISEEKRDARPGMLRSSVACYQGRYEGRLSISRLYYQELLILLIRGGSTMRGQPREMTNSLSSLDLIALYIWLSFDDGLLTVDDPMTTNGQQRMSSNRPWLGTQRTKISNRRESFVLELEKDERKRSNRQTEKHETQKTKFRTEKK